MAKLGTSTMEKFSGSIRNVYPDIPEEIFTKVYRQLAYDRNNSKEFNLFLEEYLKNNTPLSEIPNKIGVLKYLCSAWASDIIPTVKCQWEGYKKKPIDDERSSIVEKFEYVSSNGYDIFRHAETFNADYYDMITGRIYHVQEYNRAKKFGLPTPGIRVSEDGATIGYVKEKV